MSGHSLHGKGLCNQQMILVPIAIDILYLIPGPSNFEEEYFESNGIDSGIMKSVPLTETKIVFDKGRFFFLSSHSIWIDNNVISSTMLKNKEEHCLLTCLQLASERSTQKIRVHSQNFFIRTYLFCTNPSALYTFR